jgi:hypothetical protein
MIAVERATVYRAGGRRWFTWKAAVKAYARSKFRAKHPCDCEDVDYASGYPGYTCPVHDAWDKVWPRYRRVLHRRLGMPVARERRHRARRNLPLMAPPPHHQDEPT